MTIISGGHMKRKILVTGAAGSVGSLLTSHFISCGDDVYGLDSNEAKLAEMCGLFSKEQFHAIPISYEHYDFISDFLKQTHFDMLIHAACKKITRFSELYPNYYKKINVDDAISFLNFCSLINIDRVIFLSSDEAFMPHNNFGKQKEEVEKMIFSNISWKKRTIVQVLRFPFLLQSRGSVWHIFYNQAKHNLPLTVADKNSSKHAASFDEFLNAWQQFESLDLPNGKYRLKID